MYILQQTVEAIKDVGNVPVYRQVIAASYINLDKMVDALEPERILGYNTDSIKFRGAFNRSAVKEKDACEPGDYHVEDTEGDVVLIGGTSMNLTSRNPTRCRGGVRS